MTKNLIYDKNVSILALPKNRRRGTTIVALATAAPQRAKFIRTSQSDQLDDICSNRAALKRFGAADVLPKMTLEQLVT